MLILMLLQWGLPRIWKDYFNFHVGSPAKYLLKKLVLRPVHVSKNLTLFEAANIILKYDAISSILFPDLSVYMMGDEIQEFFKTGLQVARDAGEVIYYLLQFVH